MARRGIVCGGSWCVDKNKLIDHWPGGRASAFILAEEEQGGGSGANAAVDLRLLGGAFSSRRDRARRRRCGRAASSSQSATGSGSAGSSSARLPISADVPYLRDDRAADRRANLLPPPGAHALLTPDHFDFVERTPRSFILACPASGYDGRGVAGRAVRLGRRPEAGAGGRAADELEFCPVADGALARPHPPVPAHLDFLIINDAEAGEVAGIATVARGVTDVAACEGGGFRGQGMSAVELVVVHFPRGAASP